MLCDFRGGSLVSVFSGDAVETMRLRGESAGEDVRQLSGWTTLMM